MSLREKKKIETKNKIFEVSGRLFKEKGFENTTIDEITKEAEIGKGTFFNYFPTKEALLLYFAEKKDELTYSLIESETAKSIHTKDKIKNLLVFLADSYERDKELTKLMIFEYIKYKRGTGLKFGEDQSRRNRLSRILHDFLGNGVKKGEVREGIDVKTAAETLTAVYFQSVMVWLWSESDYSISEDISGKIDLVFEGIGS